MQSTVLKNLFTPDEKSYSLISLQSVQSQGIVFCHAVTLLNLLKYFRQYYAVQLCVKNIKQSHFASWNNYVLLPALYIELSFLQQYCLLKFSILFILILMSQMTWLMFKKCKITKKLEQKTRKGVKTKNWKRNWRNIN